MSQIKAGEPKDTFATGAQRGKQGDRERLELISPIFLRRLGVHLARGAKKYSDRNWEKGMPCDRYLCSALRHLNQYREGDRSEDHLAAAGFNIMALMHTLEMIGRNLLPIELNDIPTYTKEVGK